MTMLRETRVQMHETLQAAAAIGRTLLPPQPDDSHHSFTFSPTHEAFVQGLVDDRFRPGFRMRDLTLLLIDAHDRVVVEHRPRRFAPDPASLATIARMYAQAARILERIHVPVRLWPHHFDVAILRDNLGVGFLAGDEAIEEPYWYVYNTPMPDAVPPLTVGEWHRGEWTGAVLRGDPDVATIERFLGEAIAAVGGPGWNRSRHSAPSGSRRSPRARAPGRP